MVLTTYSQLLPAGTQRRIARALRDSRRARLSCHSARTSSWPIATHAFGRSSSMMDALTCAIHDRPVGRSRNASAGHFERQTKNASTIEIYHEFNDSIKVSDCAVDKVCHLHCYMMPFSNLIMVLSVKPIPSPASLPSDEPFPLDL